MATNPAQGACLKCGTPLVPGAGFCGACGTSVGSAGAPPMPPPLPPRPLAHGGRQVALPMDQGQAMQAAMSVLPGQKGEVTNQGPTQIAFRLGSFLSGRSTGTIDAFQEGPGRTVLNVSLKADYGSLVPGMIIFLAVSMISWVLLAKAGVEQGSRFDMNNPYVMPTYGIGVYIQWWMVLLFVGLIGGLCAWLLSGPLLDKRRMALMNALQAQAGGGAGLPGFPPQPGLPGFAPAVQAPAPPPQVTPIEQLKRLAELRDSGAISPADFEQAKAAIMQRIS
jgi:hypothetical protein